MTPAVTVQTTSDACQAFGAFLGLDEAVQPVVLRAALADPVYARKLVGSRGSTETIRYLLERAPAVTDTPAEYSDTELVASAVKAIARWAAAGLKRVDEKVYARRIAACQACEHLQAPPRRLIYGLLSSDDGRVCGLCGCVASKKALLPTESCPAMDLATPGFTRWGEKMG
ncbi:hypothetical protein [Pseudomonas orientalis]|uniref:hypothetical protein n=1 Tax=Pseudomonas orientalis TaxID=76758 RepID=UPI002FE28A19